MRFLLLLLLIPFFATSQTCDECSGTPVTLTAPPIGGQSPFTYSWVCNNGFNSNLASPVTTFTTSTNCTQTVIDANGCIVSQSVTVNIIPSPNYLLTEANCELNLAIIQGQSCGTVLLQYRAGTSGAFTTIATNPTFPYTITADGQYRIRVTGCTCGNFNMSPITVTGCEACMPYDLLDTGGCLLVINGNIPCNNEPNYVFKSCTGANGPWTLWLTLTSGNYFFFADQDCCYYVSCSYLGDDYCTDVVCVNDNCGIGCTGAIGIGANACNLLITWNNACTLNGWFIERLDGSIWTTVASGTSGAPTTFAVPSSGTYRARQTCTNGCSFTSATQVFTGCGSPPCSPTPTLAISQGGACVTSTTLTAVVSNCGGTPSYSWSTSSSNQTITVTTSGTYTVTVTGCCVSPLVQNITVTCSNPCAGFDVQINGATTLCDNGSINLTSTVTGGTTPYTYTWQVNGVTVGSSANLNLLGSNYSVNQNLAITLLVNSANGCVDSDAHSVQVVSCVNCVCTAPTLSFNSTSCVLTWAVSGCSGYLTSLQRQIGGVWTNIAGASPYTVTINGNYRLLLTKAGCSDVASNVVVAGCVVDPCFCDNATLTLDNTACILTWSPSCPAGFTVVLQKDNVTVPGATSPYTVPAGANGVYKLVFTKAGCSSFTTNAVTVSCAPLDCTCTGVLTDNNCELTWTTCAGWTSTLQVNTGSGYTNAPVTQPFSYTIDGTYRVLYTKAGCSDVTSNQVIIQQCNFLTNNLNFTNSTNCRISWTDCPLATSTILEGFVDGVWVTLSTLPSPYDVNDEATKYRVKFTRNNCITYTDELINPNPSIFSSDTELSSGVGFQDVINAGPADFVRIYAVNVVNCFGTYTAINLPNNNDNSVGYLFYNNATTCSPLPALNYSDLEIAVNNLLSSGGFTGQISRVGNEIVYSIPIVFGSSYTNEITEIQFFYKAHRAVNACTSYYLTGMKKVTLNLPCSNCLYE